MKKIEKWKSYGVWEDISKKLSVLGIEGIKKYATMEIIHKAIDGRRGYGSNARSTFYRTALEQFIHNATKENVPKKKRIIKITSKYSEKMYKCNECGFESLIGTNHYGEIYPQCKQCGWKYPMKMGQAHTCMEKVPRGMVIPEKWKFVKLGDVATIIEIKKIEKKS